LFPSREEFTAHCLEFQREIDNRENCKVRILLAEKYSLEKEIQLLDEKNCVLKNSVLAFVEEILEDLHNSNSGNTLCIQGSKFFMLVITSMFILLHHASYYFYVYIIIAPNQIRINIYIEVREVNAAA
jgi:hypothetical protein